MLNIICLTGDVHHSIGNPEQSYFRGSEIELAEEYVGIAEKYNIKTTLFITGKTFKESPKIVKRIFETNNIEIGGHTWSAFQPRWLHKFFRKTTGSIYGPRIYQKLDIRRTVNIIQKTINKNPLSWRTHSYESNIFTKKLLEETGLKIISDERNKKSLGPKKIKDYGLISLPLNIMPDHSHLYHGTRTKKHVEKLIYSGWSDSFTSKSYYIDEYFEIVKKQIKRIEKKKGISTLLLHPCCMKIVDNFKTFERLCKWINNKKFETIYAKDILKAFEHEL